MARPHVLNAEAIADAVLDEQFNAWKTKRLLPGRG
jgi:hypothetical protein